MVSPGPSFLPGRPIRTGGGFLKGPLARSKTPGQDFGTPAKGLAFHRGPSAFPSKDPSNKFTYNYINFSLTSPFFLLTGGVRGNMLPLYGPDGHPPFPYPGTAAHPGGLARRPPDAPPGGLPSPPHPAGSRWGLPPGRRPRPAYHLGDGVVLEAALPTGRSHRPDGHRSGPRPQATDHDPQGPADRPSHAPHPTSRGPALDYPEPGASPRGQPGDGAENLGPLRAEAALGRSPSGCAGRRPRGSGTLPESARQGVGAGLGSDPPAPRPEAEPGLGHRGREAGQPRRAVQGLARLGAHGGG